MVAFDWNNIEDIYYTFREEIDSRFSAKQRRFNQNYGGSFTIPDEMVITNDDGTKSLAPDPLMFIRRQIVQDIMALLNYSDEDTISRFEEHIAGLLMESNFSHTAANGNITRIRGEERLTKLAKQSLARNDRQIELEVSIEHWVFRRSWTPRLFFKIYRQGHEVESDDESSKKSKSDDDSSQSAKSRNNDRLVDLLEAQQVMIGDIAQIVARNNDDSSAATNERLAEALERLAEASANQVLQSNTNAGQQLPVSDDNWNTKELPDKVRERYEVRNTYLTLKQMGAFKIENKDKDGNVTGTVDVNHYLHTKPNTTLQKLITRSGDCFDLAPLNDSRKVLEKQFLSKFPKLDGEEPAEIRKWYRAIVSRAKQYHIYVHPYYNFRRDVNHNRGFTVGDDFPDDLPKRYDDVLGEWGSMLHNALCQDKVIPDSCTTMKATVQNFEEGQGYEALWGVVKSTHPNHLRSYETNQLVRSYPQQKEDERIERYYFRFNDHLQMKAYLTHPCSLDDPQEISALIGGCINHLELKDRADFERENPHQIHKYTSGNILGTLQQFETEIAFAKQQRSERSKQRTPSVISRRTGRYSKPSRYSSNRTASTATSSITTQSINLVEAVGYPDDDPKLNDDIWEGYNYAINMLDKNPAEFDTSRKCLVCGETGHAFANCPGLNNSQSLKDHRIAVGQFIRKLRLLEQKDIEARQKRISQLIANMAESNIEDDYEHIEDRDFQLGKE